MNILSHKKKGFSLLELLLYVSISGIIIFSTSLYLSTFLESKVKNQTIREVEQQGDFIMQIIQRSIRNGTLINSPTIGLSSASLSLETSDINTNPTIFDINNGIIQIREGSQASIPLHNTRIEASSLIFYNLSSSPSPGIIKVEFTLNAVNTSGRIEYTFNKNFSSAAALHQ